jgi:hypothetical protein
LSYKVEAKTKTIGGVRKTHGKHCGEGVNGWGVEQDTDNKQCREDSCVNNGWKWAVYLGRGE